MGLKSQYQIGMKQRNRRKARRKRMAAKGMNMSEFFYGKFYLKTGDAK